MKSIILTIILAISFNLSAQDTIPVYTSGLKGGFVPAVYIVDTVNNYVYFDLLDYNYYEIYKIRRVLSDSTYLTTSVDSPVYKGEMVEVEIMKNGGVTLHFIDESSALSHGRDPKNMKAVKKIPKR